MKAEGTAGVDPKRLRQARGAADANPVLRAVPRDAVRMEVARRA